MHDVMVVVTVETSALALTLATVGVVAAVYEWTSLRWRRWPPITELVKRGGWPARVLAVALGTFALVDHFLTGWLL